MCEFEYLYKSHIGETTYFSNIYKMEYALLVFLYINEGKSPKKERSYKKINLEVELQKRSTECISSRIEK
jgi:hypothetical protein